MPWLWDSYKGSDELNAQRKNLPDKMTHAQPWSTGWAGAWIASSNSIPLDALYLERTSHIMEVILIKSKRCVAHLTTEHRSSFSRSRCQAVNNSGRYRQFHRYCRCPGVKHKKRIRASSAVL